jgi:hypothetical protein
MRRNCILCIILLGALALLGGLAACGDGGGGGGNDNTLPVALNDAYATTANASLSIGAPGILGNDTDNDGDDLDAVLSTAPSNGNLALNTDGSFTYTPNANFYGTDSFIYLANDGTGSSNQTVVTITIKVPPASYAGNTNQAEITRINAAEIVRNVWELGSQREIIDVVVDVLEKAGFLDDPTNIPANLRIYTDCGDGSYADFAFQLNQATGTFSGNIIFVGYCVFWGNGGEAIYLDGAVPFDGTFAPTLAGMAFSLRLSFNNLDSTMGDASLTYPEGTATYVFAFDGNGEAETDTSNYVLRDNKRNKTYWFDNYVLKIFGVSDEGPLEATFNGRFYDHENGFVDVETDGKLLVPDIDSPTGILWFYGKGSSAKLTFTTGSTLLEVDGNNDGTVDYSTTEVFADRL